MPIAWSQACEGDHIHVGDEAQFRLNVSNGSALEALRHHQTEQRPADAVGILARGFRLGEGLAEYVETVRLDGMPFTPPSQPARTTFGAKPFNVMPPMATSPATISQSPSAYGRMPCTTSRLPLCMTCRSLVASRDGPERTSDLL